MKPLWKYDYKNLTFFSSLILQRNQRLKMFKGTVNVISSDAKMAMPDSQRYP